VYAIQQTFVGHGTPAMALFNLNIHDNSYGFISLGGKVFATNVVVNHNGTLLPNSTSSSPIGCAAHRLIGTNLQATNNGGFGITAVQLRLTDSVVTGNNGFTMGIDFSSAHRPRLVNTTCGKSLGKNGPWGVCTNDPTSPSGAFLDATGAF
jgi:hypothetical protein